MVERLDVREAQAHEIRKVQRPRSRDVSECVAAHFTVLNGVGEFADANAIEDNPDYPSEARNALPRWSLLSDLSPRRK
jgi:hypothetical protein